MIVSRGRPTEAGALVDRSMFAQYSSSLEHPFPRVWAAISDRPLLEIVSLDGAGGEELLARVGARIAGIPIYTHVWLDCGQPQVLIDGRLGLLPVNWRPTGGAPLLPDMRGDIRFEAIGVDRTRISLNARYQPPGGPLGEVVDRALMYRLADATVQDFVLRLSRQLDALLSSSAPNRG